MLTVAKVTQNAARDYAEYLEGKAQARGLGDYYLKDGERLEAPGRWAGGASALAARADVPVTGDQLRSLMAARRPDTGEPLRRHGASGETVSALDATFSAPKSVSAIWAIGAPDLRAAIEGAHERAIDRALAYSVQRVAMIRWRVDQTTVVHAKPSELIATSWRHTTARAVDDRPPDPQLHSHVLLHGAVRKDGEVVAIDSRSWLVHRREVGAAYRTELARELNHLGFEIHRGTGRGQRYFEIAGIPQDLLDRWSSRRQQVHGAIQERLAGQREVLRALISVGGPDSDQAIERLALLEQTGQLAPGQERMMATVTRSAKAPMTHGDLDEHWRTTAGEHRLGRGALERLRAPRPAMLPARDQELLEGLTEFDASFPARDARAVALERSAGVPIADALQPLQELRNSREILVLADRSGTTREHRGHERTTIAIAERLANSRVPRIPSGIIARETKRLDRQLARHGGQLSDEQRQAIRLACGNRALVMIEGQAGTGKSTALIGIARAHQAAGRQVLVTSTAALAAERLARELNEAGAQASAYSTAALHAGIAAGRISLTAKTTILHDEAALASTREQQDLLAAVEDTGARLIEIGDPQQNQPVGAGGLWPHLEQAIRDAEARVELTRNQRARDPSDRRDQALFREGKHEQAIRGYAARDRLHITTNQSHAEDIALDAAQADRRARKTTIVIAQTSNQHLDELNARAQAIRQQHRELGHESIPVPGRPYELHRGDEILIRRTLPRPDHDPLRNGTPAQITAIDRDQRAVHLRLADARTVTLDRDQIADADLRLAYVQHPFPAQGRTTDTTHLIVGQQSTQAGSYVALTRAREQTHIHAAITPDYAHVDRLAALSEQMGRTEPEVPSIDTPLAHEHTVSAEVAETSIVPERENVASRPDAELSARPIRINDCETFPEPESEARQSDEALDRTWPRNRQADLAPTELEEQAGRGHHEGWEL